MSLQPVCVCVCVCVFEVYYGGERGCGSEWVCGQLIFQPRNVRSGIMVKECYRISDWLFRESLGGALLYTINELYSVWYYCSMHCLHSTYTYVVETRESLCPIPS